MEQLIRDLNSPQNQGRPETINTIQRQIQRLQSEPAAWQGALDLLNSDDSILRFYGALTLGLKVNNDWDADNIGKNRETLSQLMEQLVMIFVRSAAAEGTTDLVISKLSQALAAVFAKPDAAWAFPCRQTLACLLAGQYLPQEQVPLMTDILTARTTVSAQALKAVLRLSLALHEEVAATPENQASHRVQVQLSNNATDVWQILHFTLIAFLDHAGVTKDSTSPYSLQVDWTKGNPMLTLQEGLNQIQFWAKYLTSESQGTSRPFDLFRSSVQMLFSLLDQPATATASMSCMTALQNENHRLLARAAPDYIGRVNDTVAVKQWIWQAGLGDFDTGSSSYVDFLESLVSHLDATTDDYLKNADMATVLRNSMILLRSPGVPVIEDPICHTLLEMMTTIAEGYSDWSAPSQSDNEMTTLLKDVCAATLNKAHYPIEELDKQTATWDEDDYTMFEDFRFDASDFFQTAFGILGPDLAMDVVKSTSQLSSPSWAEFEGTLFVLTCVTDALSNEPERCDPCLTELFASSVWAKGIAPSEHIPARVRLAMIRLVGETTSYLQRHPEYLLGSLEFLFRSLQIRSHTGQASKAIYNLCDNQRSFLVQGLPQFLETLTTIDHIPLQSRLRILSAVAALIQALPFEAEKIQPLQKMLLLVHSKESKGANDITPSAGDDPSNPPFERLSMLAAIARGLQSPSDVPIDLEDTDSKDVAFWIDGPGKAIQQAVLQMLSELWSRLFGPDSSDLVTATCDFLRAGFKEQHPSPLKFTTIVNIELLSSLVDLRNPNLDQTMNTAACYVASTNSLALSPAEAGADIILPRIIDLIRDSTNLLAKDTTSQTSTFTAPTSPLDFLTRILHRGKWGLHVFTTSTAPADLSAVIEYSLLLLRNTDTLPRRSAATFLTNFVDLTDPSHIISANSTAASNLSSLLDTYSGHILGLILHLLAGECARSELEVLSETLRKFVQRQSMRTKRIMSEATKSESGVFTAKALEATKPEQRARFVSQVEGLRGAKKTNDIVKEFWTACRGAQFGYVT